MTASTGALASGLFYRFWSASGDASAVVLISHGLGEHSGRYEHVAQAFTEKGLHVFALDHIGHGHSPGKRVYIDRFSDLTVGVSEMRDHIERQLTGLPVFLLGHSLGGLIAASVVLGAHARYAGLLLTAPAFGVPTVPPTWQLILLRVLSAVAPTLKAHEIDASKICRDSRVVDAYTADPLVNHQNIPARMVVSLFDESARVLASAGTISLPTLLLHGTEDTLTSLSASQAFVSELGSNDSRLTVYEGLYHELFNEPEKETILQTCNQWISDRLLGSV